MPINVDTVLDFNSTHTYFFSKDKYYGYSSADKPFDGYPRQVAEFGVPNDLDASLRQPWSGESWFFKGSKYWVFEPTYNRTLTGYPKEITPPAQTLCLGEQDVGAHIGGFSDRRDKGVGYAMNLDCTWRVTAPRFAWFDVLSGSLYQGIDVTFEGVSLDSTADKIEVYEANDIGWNGKGTIPTMTLLATFTSTTPQSTWSQPLRVSKASHTWYVKFTSDGVQTNSQPGNGFNVSYAVRNAAEQKVFAMIAVPRDYQMWMTAYHTTQQQVFVVNPGTQTPTSITLRMLFEAYPLERNYPQHRNITVYRGNSTSLIDFVTSCDQRFYCIPTATNSMMVTVVLNNWLPTTISAITSWITITSTCAGTQNFTAISGTISDGSGISNYYASQTCRWLIKSDDVDAILVQFIFDEFGLDNVGVSADYLYFYNSTDHLTTTTNKQIGRYTGTTLPAPVLSPISYLLLVMVVGQDDSGTGFSGRYSIIYRPEKTTTIVTGFSSFIGSSSSAIVGDKGSLLISPNDKFNRSIDAKTFLGPYFNYYLRFIPTSLSASNMNTIINFPGSLSDTDNSTAGGLLFQQLSTSLTPIYEFSPSDKDNMRILSFTAPLMAGTYKVVLMMVCKNTANPSSPYIEDTLNWAGTLTVVADKGNGPRSVVTSIPTSSQAGAPSSMLVVLYDKYGNALTHGSEDVRCFIVGADQAVFSITKLIDFSNGTYQIQHTPTIAGDYFATVLVSGSDVSNSPVSLTITAAPIVQPDKTDIMINSTYNTTNGIPVGVAVPFIVVPRDRFGNPTDATVASISISGVADAGTVSIVDGSVTAAGHVYWITGSAASVVTLSLIVNGVAIPNQLLTIGTPASSPSAPLNITAIAADSQAMVSFGAPATDGGSPITLFTVTSTPGSIRASGSSSPIQVFGLSNHVSYTFTVVATNARGNSPSSTSSNVATPVAIEYDQPGSTVALMVVLGIFIIIALIVAYVVFRTRNQMVIKTASPIFLILILFGGMMMYACGIMLVAYPPSSALCAVIPYLGHLAFALAYGSLLAKTYRVGRIFTSDVLTVLRITNKDLLGVVGAFCAAVIAYLAIWSASDAPHRQLIVGDDHLEYIVCQSDHSAWSWVIYLFEALVLGWGMMLCFKNRHIPTLFNESQWIALGIYNLALVGGIVILLDRAKLVTRPDSLMLLQVIGMLIATTGTLALVFVPKLMLLMLPDQEMVLRTKAGGTVIDSGLRNSGLGMRTVEVTAMTVPGGKSIMMSTGSPKNGNGKWARPTDMRASVAAANNANTTTPNNNNNAAAAAAPKYSQEGSGDKSRCVTCGQTLPLQAPPTARTGGLDSDREPGRRASSVGNSPAHGSMGGANANTGSFVNLGRIGMNSTNELISSNAALNAAPDKQQQSPMGGSGTTLGRGSMGGMNPTLLQQTNPPGTVLSGETDADISAMDVHHPL
jgi:hypothetical protein